MHPASRAAYATSTERVEEVAARADLDDVRRLAGDLLAVVHVVARESTLRRAVTDPALPGDSRATLLTGLLGDRIAPVSADVLGTAIRAHWAAPSDFVNGLESLAVTAWLVLAERTGALDDVEDELFRFGRIIDREPALRAALADPSAPVESRTTLLDTLLSGRAGEVTLALVAEAVLHPRGRTLDRVLSDYVDAAAARRERLVALVRVAAELTDAQRERLAAALAGVYGHQVHLNVETDPTVIGGISVRVGGEVYDATVLHRLAEARRRLAG